jgi:hypothetical protein
MNDVQFIRDLDDDPDGWTDESRSSGRPITFGTTHTGRRIAVVWEHVDDPLTVYVVTAYEVGE